MPGAVHNGVMAGVADDELAALRARAYGPDADIDADPEALARLRQLERIEDGEDESREPGHALGGTRARVLPDARRGPHGHARQDAGGPAERPGPREGEGEPSPDRDGAERPLHRQGLVLAPRVRAGWIASLIAVAAVATTLTAWSLPFGVRDDQHHDAQMAIVEGEASPDLIRRLGAAEVGTVRSFGEYHGLEVFATQYCLHVVLNRERGPMFTDCAGGGLSPIVDVYVPATGAPGYTSARSDYPQELTRHVPDGAVIRFERRGDAVLVDEGDIPGAR